MAWTAEQNAEAEELLASPGVDEQTKASLRQKMLEFKESEASAVAKLPGVSAQSRSEVKAQSAQRRGLNPQLSGAQLGGYGAPTGVAALEQSEPFQKATIAGDDLAAAGKARWAKSDPLSFAESPSETALAGMPEQQRDSGGLQLRKKPGGGYETSSNLIERRLGQKKMSPLPGLETEGGLPSQTGDKALYRPPEFVPPNAPFSTILKSSRVEFEPTVDQFRASVAPQLGPRVLDLDENSSEYKAFADKQWAQKYDIASKAGFPITRKQYMNTDSWTGKAASALYTARDKAETTLTGIASGLTGGTGPEAIAALTGDTDQLREQNARNPLTNIVATFVGAFNPASAASRLTAGAKGLFPALGQTAKGAAVLGAGVGAVEGIGAGVGHTVGNIATGQEAIDEGSVAPAVTGALLGAPFGAAGHKLGELAGGAVRALRRNIPQLPVAEAAGVETSATSRLKAPPWMRGYIDEAQRLSEESAIGGTPKTAVQVAAEANAPKVARQAGSRDAAIKARHDAEKLSYQLDPQVRDLKITPKHGIAKIGEIIERKSDDLGDELMVSNVGPFQKMMNKAFTPMIMDPDAARVAAATDGGWVMQPDKAKSLGLLDKAVELTPNGRRMPFDPEQTARLGPAKGAVPPAGMEPQEVLGNKVIVMVPKKLSVAQLEEVIQHADELASVAKVGGNKPEAYGELMDAFRRDMHDLPVVGSLKGTKPVQLPRKTNGEPGEVVQGYAALRFRQSEELAGKQEQFERAGLPPRVGPRGWKSLEPSEKMKLEAELAKFGRRSPAKDKAMLEVVKDKTALKDVAGTRAFQELNTDGPGVPYLSKGSLAREALGALVPGRSLRLDPLMRKLAMSTDEASNLGFDPNSESESIRKSLRLPYQYGKRVAGKPTKFEKMLAEMSFRGFEKAMKNGDYAEAARLTRLKESIRAPHKAGLSAGLRGGGLGGRAAAVGNEEEKRRRKRKTGVY